MRSEKGEDGNAGSWSGLDKEASGDRAMFQQRRQARKELWERKETEKGDLKMAEFSEWVE